jgi:hypothetical protein
VSTAGSTAGPPVHDAATVAVRNASTRRRSRGGITGTTLASARTDASATPATPLCAAACRPTANATASSSSSTSGGIAAPAASW